MRLFVHVVVEGEAKDVRSYHVPGRNRVVVDRECVSADRVEEAVDLALRVVEPPRAGPAIAAAVDRLVAEGGADPIELGGDQIEGAVPFHFDEWLVSPAFWFRAGPAAEPRLSDRRALDPAPPHGFQRLTDRGWVGVLGEGVHRGDLAAIGLDLVGAPVGERAMSSGRRFSPPRSAATLAAHGVDPSSDGRGRRRRLGHQLEQVGVQLKEQGSRQRALAKTPVDLLEQPQPPGEYVLRGHRIRG